MVTWRTRRAIVGIAWTNAGDAVACATEDGGVVVARARDGVFAWTREGDEEGIYIVHHGGAFRGRRRL